jgi:hypothetical protein
MMKFIRWLGLGAILVGPLIFMLFMFMLSAKQGEAQFGGGVKYLVCSSGCPYSSIQQAVIDMVRRFLGSQRDRDIRPLLIPIGPGTYREELELGLELPSDVRERLCYRTWDTDYSPALILQGAGAEQTILIPTEASWDAGCNTVVSDLTITVDRNKIPQGAKVGLGIGGRGITLSHVRLAAPYNEGSFEVGLGGENVKLIQVSWCAFKDGERCVEEGLPVYTSIKISGEETVTLIESRLPDLEVGAKRITALGNLIDKRYERRDWKLVAAEASLVHNSTYRLLVGAKENSTGKFYLVDNDIGKLDKVHWPTGSVKLFLWDNRVGEMGISSSDLVACERSWLGTNYCP